ncbi:MAG: DUF2791 family P-loop domain-containing protein [Bacillota bacterium]|nr:DUF2791 family P-loop domain-containing protein [Bacillota bacterium]
MNRAVASPHSIDALFVIESLRSGIPTRRSTRELPDLRQEISGRILHDLEQFEQDQYPPGRILWGQYGQGKTHALAAIEHQALDRNFAVSRVTLSREISCHNLMDFYSEAAGKLRTPDSSIDGLARYLERLGLDNVRRSVIFSPDRYVHNLPVLCLEAYLLAAGENREKLYADLMGTRLPAGEFRSIYRQVCGERLPALRFRIHEHAYAYFSMMADLIQLCGFEGWVILIDEAELIGRLGRISRMRAYQNLGWLLGWASGSKPGAIYTIAAAASRLQDDLWYGGRYVDRDNMPQLAAERAGEAKAHEAEHDMRVFFRRAIGRDSLVATPAKHSALVALLEEITRLHGIAYDWEANFDVERLLKHLGTQPVRTYIRATLEHLDLEMLYHEDSLPDADVLAEHILGGDGADEAEDAEPDEADEEPGGNQF